MDNVVGGAGRRAPSGSWAGPGAGQGRGRELGRGRGRGRVHIRQRGGARAPIQSLKPSTKIFKTLGARTVFLTYNLPVTGGVPVDSTASDPVPVRATGRRVRPPRMTVSPCTKEWTILLEALSVTPSTP